MFAAGPANDPGYAAMSRASGSVAIIERYPNTNPAMPGNTGVAGGIGLPNTEIPQVNQPGKPNTVVDTSATGKGLITYVIIGLIAWWLYRRMR